MRIDFLYFIGCPHAEEARRLLRRCHRGNLDARLDASERVRSRRGRHARRELDAVMNVVNHTADPLRFGIFSGPFDREAYRHGLTLHVGTTWVNSFFWHALLAHSAPLRAAVEAGTVTVEGTADSPVAMNSASYKLQWPLP